MHDPVDLVRLIKKAALDAVEASKPCNILFGTVTSVSPLQINVEQKMILTSAQLVLSRNVTNYKVKFEIDSETEDSGDIDLTHSHNYSGKTETYNSHTHDYSGTTESNSVTITTHSHKFKGTKEMTIKNALKVNDEVIMVRMQGGQKYVVIDRVVNI